MTASSRPAAGALAYYRCSWIGAPAEEPSIFWYEVDHSGAVLRSVEIHSDGRMKRDAVACYPDGTTDFGFGTLIGDDFYRVPWEWPQPEDAEATVMLDASAGEFEAVWNAGAS